MLWTKHCLTLTAFSLIICAFGFFGRELKAEPDMPEYSEAGGWYKEDIIVEISGSGNIYYTTDGSDPDENSLSYNGPIRIYDRSTDDNIYASIKDVSVVNEYTPDYLIDKCTVLKAISVKDGERSPVRSETYFVGLSGERYDKIPTISISMSPDDLFDYEKGIYVTGKVFDDYVKENGYEDEYEEANYAERGRDWEREAEIEYFAEDHCKVFEQHIGVRIHGGSSRALNQKSFSLFARREYDGNDAFVFDPLDTSIEGLKHNKLVLRSGGDVELYITKMRDVLMQSLVSDRDIATQKAIPCNVFLNGEYWGMYNLQEALNERYLQRLYGVKPENIMYLKNKKPNRTEPDAWFYYNEMVGYAADHDMSIDENYRHMEELIDIQSCIDYYAAEIYSGNPDSFWNNLAVWKSISYGGGKYEDCRWRWILLDLDDGAALKTEFSGADIDSFKEGNYWGNVMEEDPLFSSLLRNDEFRDRFVASFTDMIGEEYRYEKASPVLKAMADRYRDANIQSQRRFRGDFVDDGYFPGLSYVKPYSEKDFDTDISVLDDFLKKRGGYMLEYMKQDLGER